MLKKLVIVWSVGLVAVAAHANTEWHSNPAKNTGAQTGGNAALTDMSYWKDANGNVGSGAPTASDDLIFDNNATSGSNPLRLRFSTVNFTGNSLQIGTDARSSTVVFDSTPFACANEGLKFKHGHWWFNSGPGADRRITCDVTVLAEDAMKPFVLHWGQDQYSNGIGRITGKLKGGANAQLRFGPWGSKLGDTNPLCARNSTFWLYDISEYAGTITVAAKSSYTNFPGDDHNYGTRLRLNVGTTTSPA